MKGLRGLPMSLLKNSAYKKVYVKYRFFGGEDFMVSPEYNLKMNVEAIWKEVLKFRVSKELCDYVIGAALGFEVWVTTGTKEGAEAGAEVGAEAGAMEAKGGEEEEEDAEEEEEGGAGGGAPGLLRENEFLKAENDALREKLALALRRIEILSSSAVPSEAELGEDIAQTPRTIMKLEVVRQNDGLING